MGEAAAFVGAGGAGMLALVVLYLLNANRLDRRDYDQAIDKAEARADAAEHRTEAERQRTHDARAAAEEARQGRYRAEEAASALRAENAVLKRNEQQP